MKIMKHEGDWCYLLVAIDTPATALGPFESFVDLWRAKRCDERLPAWRDFELSDFQGWWGWITVIDFLAADPRDHRYRLWGSQLTNATEIEMTSLRMADNWDGPGKATSFTDIDIEFLAAIRTGENIGWYTGPLNSRFPGVQTLQTIRMPLADDGVTVDKVMSATLVSSPEKAWWPPGLDDRHSDA